MTAPGIGHNQPPAAALEEETNALLIEIDAFIKEDSAITDDTTHQSYENAVKKFSDLKKRQDEAHKTEKQPWLDGGKAVDDAYRDQRQKVSDAIKILKAKIGGWLNLKRKRQEEEARKAREEADRKAREAEEARRKAEEADTVSLVDQAAARDAEKDAKEAEKQARTLSKAKVSTAGGTRIVRYKVAVISNELRAYQWALTKHGPETREFLEKLATAAARAGEKDIPGFEIETKERAA